MKSKIAFLLLTTLLLSSCSTTGVVRPPAGEGGPVISQVASWTLLGIPRPERMSVYHTVAPGETLWRIGKMYDVDADAIKRVNRIGDIDDIDIGSKLYIPDAAPRKDIITLYPSTKWKYIIIHHSATDIGNSEFFDGNHKDRGWEGIGYHFVIDNGTCGKDDGQVETTPRWLKQEGGAHCKAGGMNEKSIGICLVGNFCEERVSWRQKKSLVYLVKQLKDYYNIPLNRILGHSQVPGAKTECPGSGFPWRSFYWRLKR